MIESYRGGYLKALLDIQTILRTHRDSFSWARLLPKRSNDMVCNLIDHLIKRRDELMKAPELMEFVWIDKEKRWATKEEVEKKIRK